MRAGTLAAVRAVAERALAAPVLVAPLLSVVRGVTSGTWRVVPAPMALGLVMLLRAARTGTLVL